MRLFLLLCLAGGCSSKHADSSATPGSGSGSATTTAHASELAVTIAGKPATIAQAYIKQLPYDGGYTVYLTSGTSSCAELLVGVYDEPDDEQTALFSVGQRLAKDGALTTQIVDVARMGKQVTIAPGSKLTVPGAPAAGAKLELPVELDADVAGEGKIAIHGVISAEGCGTQPFPADVVPKAPHASTATLQIASTRVPLVGARYDAKADQLELSSGPLVCGPSTALANVTLTVAHLRWELHGEWFGGATVTNTSGADANGQEETKGMSAKLGALGTSADGPTVPVELSGSGTIGGTPVAVAGTIEALACP